MVDRQKRSRQRIARGGKGSGNAVAPRRIQGNEQTVIRRIDLRFGFQSVLRQEFLAGIRNVQGIYDRIRLKTLFPEQQHGGAKRTNGIAVGTHMGHQQHLSGTETPEQFRNLFRGQDLTHVLPFPGSGKAPGRRLPDWCPGRTAAPGYISKSHAGRLPAGSPV